MSITVQNFIELQQGSTDLNWVAGYGGHGRLLSAPNTHGSNQIGYLNLLHPECIGVLSHREIEHYRQMNEAQRQQLYEALLTGNPPALIVSDALDPPPELMEFCNRHDLPLLRSVMAAGALIDSLAHYLTRGANASTSMHGVLMDVLGMGVLISGDSGLGKSELALELISRGHGLVADDVVDIERVNPHTIIGRCPPLLQGLLEVRGLGLLDIRTVFGESATRRHMSIRLIVHLVRRSTLENDYQRLPLEALTETILGVTVRKVAIPVAAGRNIAVLTETAVRSTILLLRGIDTTREFAKRQQNLILSSMAVDEARDARPPGTMPANRPDSDDDE